MKKLLIFSFSVLAFVACQKPVENPAQKILLMDYTPVSVNNIPVTQVDTPKYYVLDMHSHDYVADKAGVDAWVKNMDACHIAKTTVLHCSWIGEDFETVLRKYEDHRDRFDFWCCFDYTRFGEDDFAEHACAELERMHALGAVGVGELGDKGLGDTYARPVPGNGIHIDNLALRPLLAKAAELKMPVSIHIAEPYWMYLPMDAQNDGLMNGASWHVDTSVEGCLDYDELMTSFENAARENPNTTFIACHYLNMSQDYPRLSEIMDKYPNVYVDISGRNGEAAQTARASRDFIIKYQDRVLFGTDNGTECRMYRNTFRILETEDEHFYIPDYGYHWYYNAFYLPDEVLEKVYHLNAEKLMGYE